LRGFSEQDAVRLQLAFERAKLGERAVLTFNHEFRLAKITLGKAANHIGTALSSLLRQHPEARQQACNALLLANGRMEDIFTHGQFIPSNLYKEIRETLASPIATLESRCRETATVKLGDELSRISENFVTLAKAFEKYESPVCKGELCAGLRFFRPHNPEFDSLEWKAHRNLLAMGKAYPRVKRSQASCEIIDLDANATVALQADEDGIIGLRFLNPTDTPDVAKLSSLLVLPAGEIDAKGAPSALAIEMSHAGAVQLLEAEGFVAETFQARGILAPGTREKASIRFALMDPKRAPESSTTA